MNSNSRVLSSWGSTKWHKGREEFHLSIGTFLRQLFLFDEIIVQSVQLKEFKQLIDLFGFNAVMALLKSGAIRLRCEAVIIGDAGQVKGFAALEGRAPLPLKHYYLVCIEAAHRNEYLVGCLPNLTNLTSISTRQNDKLMAKVLTCIEDPIADIGSEMLNQTISDLRNNTTTIKLAVAEILRRERNIDCPLSELSIRIVEVKNGEFYADSNLGTKLGISIKEEHRIIQGAILSIGNLNQRIAEMKIYKALAGFSSQDIPLFNEKLSFLVRQLDPDKIDEAFIRVLEYLGLPDLGVSAMHREVKLERILQVRNSKECRQFRQWLAKASDISNEELKKEIQGLRARIGEMISSPVAKVCRFLIVGGIGNYSVPVGFGVGALDQFLLDRLFPRSRPAGFLAKLYPSVFELVKT